MSEGPKQNYGRGLVDRKLAEAPPPPYFIAGRPKAALLFWFFGDFSAVRQNIERQKREATLNRLLSQSIDATFNSSTNDRTTNNRTISVKNDNDLTARQLLRVIEIQIFRSD